jgi:hypothetical protein
VSRVDGQWVGFVVDRSLHRALVQGAAAADASIETVASAESFDGPLDALAERAALTGAVAIGLDIGGPVRETARRRALRVASLATSTLALTWAAVAPGWQARKHAIEQERAADTIALAAAPAAAAAQEAWLGPALEQLQLLAADRGQASALLAALGHRLPDSTAVVALRLGQAGGTITLLGNRVLHVVPVLTEIAGLAALRPEGALTRELHDGAQLQRVSLVWKPVSQSISEPRRVAVIRP